MVSHGEFLRAVTHDHTLVAALQLDNSALADLNEKDRTLLSFARVLNNSPSEIHREDMDRLRAAGFTDQNIFDAVVLVAYFNFMNRIADGFGVEPDPERQKSYETHLAEVLSQQRPQVLSD